MRTLATIVLAATLTSCSSTEESNTTAEAIVVNKSRSDLMGKQVELQANGCTRTLQSRSLFDQYAIGDKVPVVVTTVYELRSKNGAQYREYCGCRIGLR